MLKTLKILFLFSFLAGTHVFATGLKGYDVLCGALTGAGHLDDTIPPDTPLLDTVSVNNAIGKVVLGWEPSVATDVEKYFIYRKIGAPWQLIDSVYIPNTIYTDMTSSPLNHSEIYCIAAKDSSNKLSAMGVIHKTIFLSLLKLNPCNNVFSLQWSQYINMSPSIAGYRVMVSENGGPYTQLAVTDPTITTYEHTGLDANAIYCYYVQAFDSLHTRISTSNMQCALVHKPDQPQYVYLRYASVKDNDHVRVGFFVDSTAYIGKYKILRSEDGINYDEIATIPHGTVYDNLTYDDATAKFNEKSYYYKVVVDDSCNNDLLTSNVGKTIYLEGNANDFLYNNLGWSAYEDRTPQANNVLREIDDFEPYNRIHSLVLNETSYQDDLETYTESGGRFRYTIQAPLNDIFNATYTFADTVYSNELVLLQPPRLYVPNAFTPDGMNNIFKPIGVFTEKDNYKLIIYNRWGQKVFETTDYNEGWNGVFEGKKAETGAYAYYIYITNAYNKSFEKRGTVMLMR